MAYDEDLANRVREVVQGAEGVTEMRMFGGLAFMINGNTAVTVSSKGGLMLRVDPADTDALLGEFHARRVVMRGREMDGWLRVDPDGVTTDRQLETWVGHGIAYARSLPPKRR